MKKNYLMTGVFAALVLGNTIASAQTEYPAADFQPKVVYKDDEYISKHQQSAGAGATAADAKYPAANFQPKVLYKDPNYKPSKAAPAAPSSSTAVRPAPSASAAPQTSAEVATAKPEKEESSSLTVLIGLLVAGAVAFFLLKKRPESTTQRPQRRARARTPIVSKGEGGLTGVAKYLSEKEGANTGVSRYLEKQKQTPVSGVAKYLAKQVLREREAAAAKVTGVEKYLRERG